MTSCLPLADCVGLVPGSGRGDLPTLMYASRQTSSLKHWCRWQVMALCIIIIDIICITKSKIQQLCYFQHLFLFHHSHCHIYIQTTAATHFATHINFVMPFTLDPYSIFCLLVMEFDAIFYAAYPCFSLASRFSFPSACWFRKSTLPFKTCLLLRMCRWASWDMLWYWVILLEGLTEQD